MPIRALYYNSRMAKNSATLILRLPAAILAQLDRVAGDAFESRSIIARKLIEAGLLEKFGTADAVRPSDEEDSNA